jgi:hypothetical protein
MRTNRATCFGLTAAVLWSLASGGALAQAPVGLGTVKGLQCSLLLQSAGSWRRDGTPEAAVKPSMLTLRFEAIDGDVGTAQLKTGAMGVEVTVRFAGGYLHFMQSFRTGPLYTTTVFEAGGRQGRFKAVHSRHEYYTTPLPGATSSPEQYYGECEPLP